MKSTRYGALGAAGLIFTAVAAHAECGTITEAEMDWASAELMANVDKIILEAGYDCTVDLIPGATMTTFASMNEKGEPMVAPELWINAVRDPLAAAVEEGRLKVVLEGPITGLGEGWWVTPKFAEDHPEITTVEQLLEHPEYFPYQEDESKGAFMGCPAGWGCQLTNANLFRAFDMENKGWELVDPGSAAGLDGAIAKAYEREEYWFGYYWAPTSVIGKYGLKMLDWEAEWAGTENWDGCIVKPEQECLDPQATSYTESAVDTVVTTEFAEAGGEALDYFTKRIFPGDIMNEMLVYMTDNQATGEDAAYYFLEEHADVWEAWVSPEAAEMIKSEL